VPRRESHYHGLLVVDKPGLQHAVESAATHTIALCETAPRLHTSHDIVQLVRRWSGQRRIGHTGTLDPMASGVLVLCLGQATRLVEYYQGHSKQYYAEVTLGSATDTYDQMGVVSAESPVPPLTTADIEAALGAFRGEIWQMPPVYSALKQDGESVHHKARRGETVTLAARPLTIHQLDLLDFIPPNRLVLRILCSAGTYIRSLAHDLGQALHTHGHLSLLRREMAGAFALDDAYSLEQIETIAQAGDFASILLPLGHGLEMAEIQLGAEAMTRLGYGQAVALPNPPMDARPTFAKGMTPDGALAGILQCLGKAQSAEQPADAPSYLWKAEKWFATN